MKKIKLGLLSTISIPLIISPTLLTGCSVYKDLKKGFTPSYGQISGKLTPDQAVEVWFKKAKETSNFIIDENYWTESCAATYKYSGSIPEYPKLTYTCEITKYNSYFNYGKISDYAKRKLSYKFNSEVEEEVLYYYDNKYVGKGIDHYTIEFEFQNIAFTAEKYYSEPLKHDFLYIKPIKFNVVEGWKDYLTDDEVVKFNLRYLVEAYNSEGVQGYGYEATEASVMDSHLSYIPNLTKILNQFIGFYSYYLDPCELI